MPSFGASAVVINSGKVLLIQREDFEVWGLPGGSVDPGESVAQTAVREVREETGIEITLIRMVGIYSSPRWHNGGDHVVVFAATPKNEAFTLSKDEVIDAGYVLTTYACQSRQGAGCVAFTADPTHHSRPRLVSCPIVSASSWYAFCSSASV